MSHSTSAPFSYPAEALRPTVDYLLASQRENGEIPWFDGGHTDPWNHTEAAMGLSIAGEFVAAERAYDWLASEQLDDGSWWASYVNGTPANVTRRETNYVAYIATGVWHHYLISEDRTFLERLFPIVERAMDYDVSMQSEHGEVAWACDTSGKAMDDALVTGSSSVYKSLECALHIARTLGVLKPSGVKQDESSVRRYDTAPSGLTETGRVKRAMQWTGSILFLRVFFRVSRASNALMRAGMNLWSLAWVVGVRIISLGSQWPSPVN